MLFTRVKTALINTSIGYGTPLTFDCMLNK